MPCVTASRCSRENRRLRRCGDGSLGSALESSEAIAQRVERANRRACSSGEGEGVPHDPKRSAEVAPSVLVERAAEFFDLASHLDFELLQILTA